MVDIPPDVQIRATLRPGAVCYFPEETFNTVVPHYFVVLNHQPLTDQSVVLICASSQVDNVRRRTRRFPGTLVELSLTDYRDFSAPITAFDGNAVLTKSVSELIAKLRDGNLKMKTEMPPAIVARLREAVLASPTVDRKTKAILQASD